MSRYRRRRPGDGRGDSGYTLAEMVIVLFITSIVVAIATGMIVMVQRNAANVTNTVHSLEQDQIASDAVIPFLHAALAVTSATSDSLTFTSYSGINDYNSSGSSYGEPLVDTITAQFVQVGSVWQFQVTAENPSGVTTTVIATDSEAPITSSSTGAYSFSYWNAAGTQLGNNGSDNGTVPSCALYAIARVDISVPFVTGNQKGGNIANEVTWWQTNVFLQNSGTTTTSTVTGTTTACSD